jgi:hypothetical protein
LERICSLSKGSISSETGPSSYLPYPLANHFKQDADSLQCFLSTYELAITEQSRFRALQAEAAKPLFFLHSLPLNIQLDNDDDMSSYTSFLSVGSETAPMQLSDQ